MKDFLKRHAKLLISLLLILQMLFIFTMSSFGSDSSNAQSGQIIQVLHQVFPSPFISHLRPWRERPLPLFVRKTAHFTEYAILWHPLLSFYIVKSFHKKNGLRLFCLSHSFLVFLYACTDEIHQLFVPGRSGQFYWCLRWILLAPLLAVQSCPSLII